MYSISQVARSSGVSARALRHYDAIGLLTPASVGANGYRWYGRTELLRLQRILVLRRLGLGLEKIAEVLAEQADEASALRGHLAELEAERDRLAEVITTVEATIADLDDARITDPDQFFTGLRHNQESLRSAYGERVTFENPHLTIADYEHAAAQGAALFRRLAEAMVNAPDSEAALDAVAEHYASLQHYWQPTAQSYAAVGASYLTDPVQRSIAEQADPGLPAWLAQAIPAYARRRFTGARS
jgi:DNA-binding transcriptional MerR regulator